MKRKLKEAEESVEIEKISKKVKNDTNDAVDDEEHNDEDNLLDDVEPIEFISDFDIKKFRQNLKIGNFYDDLKLFLKRAAKSPEIIRAFTDSGGKPLEIVEIIKNNEESSLEVVSNLYHMLRMLIFYIVNDENQRRDSTVQALKFLVNKNKISIEKMLGSTKTSDKVLILKILSIATSLDTEIGRDILKNIEVFAKSTEKDDFSMLIDDKKKKTPYEDSIRLAFVHFILGFLFNDKDVVLRKKILQKRSLFEFFLQGLHADSFETVKSVVTCLTKNVLISPAFNKPEKLKIFTDNAIKSVMKLYEWKGSAEETSSVVNIAHQFLLLLLTSKKHGIVFKALSEKRQNVRQLQVIKMFSSVWNQEHQSMLVIEIIKSCPDLMQNVLNRLVMGLQPKLTTNWFMCANFTRELLSTLEPSTMFSSFSMLEPKKISTNIIKLSISQFILQNLNERALIQQDSLEVRETSVQLLHLMLSRCCKYLDEVRKISTLKDFEKHRIKFDIINHIFTFYPKIDIILNSLYRSINLSTTKKSEENDKLVKSQLKHTLEILLLVIANFPSIIEKIPSVIDYLEVLRPIYEYQLSGADADVNKNEDLEIEMKVVKIILFLQPSILALNSEMFQRIFLVLIQVFCCSSTEEYRRESKTLLQGILKNTSIFPSGDSWEISIWLESFRSVKRGILKESAATFVKVLRSVKTQGGETLKWSSSEDVKCDYDLLALIDAAETETSSFQFTPSPVLPALIKLKSNKTNRIIDFVEIAVVLFYHSHPELKKSLLELLSNDQVELNTNIVGYIKKKSLVDFGETLEIYSDLLYRKFQLAVIEDKKILLEIDDNQQLELLIVQAVFCAIQLEKSGKLSDKKLDLLVSYVEDFYTNLKKNEDENFTQIEETQEEDKKVNKICELEEEKPTKSIVSYIYKQQSLMLEIFSVSEPNQITKFIAKLSDILKSNEHFEELSNDFRGKIVRELTEVVTSGGFKEGICEIVEKFPLDAANFLNLISIVVKLKSSVKEFHIKLLKMMIERLTSLKTSPLTSKLMQKLEKIYVEAASNTPIDLIDFEIALLNYLSTFSHNIGDLSEKTLSLAFREDQTPSKSFIRLISFVLTRNDEWNEAFKTNLMKCRKEILYPLLSVGFDKKIITAEQLKPIYQDFKSGIIKAIEKPNKAAQIYRENAQTSMKLIELAMPLNECQDLSMKKYKFEASEIYQLKMLHGIFKKSLAVNEDVKVFMNFTIHWFNLFALSINKSAVVNEEYLEVLEEWLKVKPSIDIIDSDVNHKSWEVFYRTCLKNGLKSSDGSKMLVLLGKVIRTIPVNLEDVTNIFDMILTHSNFFNVIFNFKTAGRVLKTNLFFLLNVLVQKNPAVAHEKHVPIFLSSYQATMSPCDQLILNLLRFYELRCEIDFYDYRPFLFGPAALSHFTNNDELEMKLVKKSVDDMNVVFAKLLNLFEKSMIVNTVNNYPLKRQLAGVAANDLDQYLVQQPEAENFYDPGYFLPLFEMILGSSTFGFTSFAIRNNLMSLILPALSCEDENMRLLAAHILIKCRESTENKKATNEIWVRFFDSLQQGFSEISEGTKGDDGKDKHFPRAASISTQFLAEITCVLPNTLHHVYNIVANYLVVKEKFDFSVVPELLGLFHSHDMHQEEHRMFLLNVTLNGIKDDLDFKLLNNTPLMKMIFSCHGCPLSDRKIDLAILKIIDQMVTKTGKVEILLQRYGLALWVFQVAAKVEAFEYDAIEAILTLIFHIFEAIQKDMKDNDETSFNPLLASLQILLPKFTKAKLSVSAFTSFLKTINGIGNFEHIEKIQHDLIIDLMKIFVPENLLQHVTYLDNYPEACKFVDNKEIFVKTLPTDLDTSTKDVLLESREFMINYHKRD